MTPEDERRIRELPRLIANEKDNEKVIKLAAELEKLLTRRAKEKKGCRNSLGRLLYLDRKLDQLSASLRRNPFNFALKTVRDVKVD